MRVGVRVGIDVGKARIGVARTDLHGMLATPVETVPRAAEAATPPTEALVPDQPRTTSLPLSPDIARILAIADELDAVEFVVGLPLSMSGDDTPSTADARRFAERLARAGGLPVRMVDERLTTVSAQSALHANGRNTRRSRPVIDQVAAVILVQHALDSERSSGKPPGILIDPSEGKGSD